jgi:tRNA nucleotidyltransferase (CCA-adding enzyme)
VRFEQRFNFKIESRTLQLMDEARAMLSNVSGDRLQHELNLMLLEPAAATMLRRLDELDLLRAIQSDLSCSAARAAQIEHALNGSRPCPFKITNRQTGGLAMRQAMGYLIWLLDLPPGALANVCQRLRFSRDFRQVLEAATRLWYDLPALKELPVSQVVARLDQAPELAQWAACQMSPDPGTSDILEQYETTWKHIKPGISGNHLKKLGVSPGPVYSEILDVLRSGWLDGRITNKTQETHLLNELLEAHGIRKSAL